ncbi:MAG: glucosaminidase domain-containing protein [Chitinophagaceae bacterium]
MQRRVIIFFLLIIIAATKLVAQKASDVLEYIASFKDIAIKEMKRTGVPAAIKLAQGIHETEAGKSDLVVKSNNHFGIKCKADWNGDRVFHDDDSRGECFRSYSNPEQSFMDHSDFLKRSSRYSFLFELDPTDYEGWAFGLKKAGYATNVKYSQILINLIRTYNLEDYTLIALGKMKESDHLLATNNIIGSIITPREESAIVDAGPQMMNVPPYPAVQFAINNTKVIYVNSKTPWLSLAEQYNIPLSRLWDFNDLEKDDDILQKPQLVYLQRKRKVGGGEFHVMKNGEDLYDVCQSEGIRYESLLELNHLNGNRTPAVGEKLNLKYPATAPPSLALDLKNKLSYNNLSEKNIPRAENIPSNKAQLNIGEPEIAFERTTHLVSSNETLYSISKKYGVELEKIMKWNRLDNMNVKIGQSLIIYKNN